MADETPQQDEAINFDEMFQGAVDQNEVQQTLSDTLLDAGWYRALPPANRTNKQYEGRPSVDYFVPVAKAPKKGESFVAPERPEGRLRLSVSHVRRNKMVKDTNDPKKMLDTGEPDSRSVLWAQAVKAFSVAAGRQPETIGEVYEYLTSQPVNFRVTKFEPADGEPRNFVAAIAPVRE